MQDRRVEVRQLERADCHGAITLNSKTESCNTVRNFARKESFQGRSTVKRLASGGVDQQHIADLQVSQRAGWQGGHHRLRPVAGRDGLQHDAVGKFDLTGSKVSTRCDKGLGRFGQGCGQEPLDQIARQRQKSGKQQHSRRG